MPHDRLTDCEDVQKVAAITSNCLAKDFKGRRFESGASYGDKEIAILARSSGFHGSFVRVWRSQIFLII
jgi:hypothetical protein